MKKLCILLSVLMVIGMFGTVAFADNTTDAKITLTADKETVEVGDIVTITVGVTCDSNGKALLATPKVCPTWDSSYFEYVDKSGEVTSSTFKLKNEPGFGTGQLSAKGYVTFTQKIAADEIGTVSGDYIFGSFKLKAIKPTAVTAAIALHADTAVKAGNSLADSVSYPIDTKIDIKITNSTSGGVIGDISPNPTVVIDGSQVIFADQKPIIKDGRTLVPARGVFEAMGARVKWLAEERRVQIDSRDNITRVYLTIDSDNMELYKFKSIFAADKTDVKLDVAAQIINDRTMIPLRAVSEAFNCKVDWDDATITVIITTK